MTEQLHELVLRARRRDTTAFESLIDHFERSALAVAYALLKDSDAAGDAVQEAFLRAWQQLPRLKDSERFASWLMQIVRNAAIDMHRRARPTAEFPEWQPAGEAADPVRQTQAAQTRQRVQDALQVLDETTRTAIMLRYYDGLSSKEISELLGLSPAAIDMRLCRARGQLKELLADLVEAELPPPPHHVGERS